MPSHLPGKGSSGPREGAGGWGRLALPGHGLWAAGTCCLRPLAGTHTINKTFQAVTSTLNPLKAVLLWAH